MKTKNATFTMNRSGEFSVKTTGNFHCGLKPILQVKYHVKVTCTCDSLDNRGFLFDQLTVDQYFQNIGTTALSCELFCRQTARDLYKVVMAQNKNCVVLAMDVMLSPEPFAASMTFGYIREELPALGAVAAAVETVPTIPAAVADGKSLKSARAKVAWATRRAAKLAA